MKPRTHKLLPTAIVTMMIVGMCTGCFLIPTQHSHHSAIHDYSRDGNLAFVMQDISTNPSDLNLPDDAGLTPLHLAALHCHTNVVAFLLEKGAKVNRRSQDGATPLHLAAQEGCFDVVNLLLANCAKINLRDDQNRTPLDRAEAWHQEAVTMLLTKKGGTQ